MKNNNKGFTLIEILAAITILAIISTIATVAVFRYLDRTRKSSYETMEKSICDAANNYVINEGLESDVVEAGDNGVTYDAKELMSSKYLENLMDPKNNKKVCSANVNVRVTDATLDDDAIPEYYYFVKLRCKDYSSDVGFSSGCALNKNVSDPGTDEPVVEPDDDGNGDNTPDTSDKTLYGVVAKSSNGTDAHISSLPTLSKGVYTMDETLNDNFPIHYYRGNVDNNNVILNGFCWKIVRTTSTGGVKLLYNGVVNADGGCNNTGTASEIGKAKFNESSGSLSDFGYMFGDRYNISFIRDELVRVLTGGRWSSALYSKNITYSNGNYKLLNPVTRTDKDDNSGYYYCNSLYSTTCSEVYYVISGYTTILLKDGVTDPSTYTIILSKTITDNGNGTYTLSNPEVLKRIDWPNDYSKYKGYYFCRDLTSTTCENKNLITWVDYTTFEYDNKYNYVYGSDVSWDGTKYTLVDTFVSKNLWYGDRNTIGEKYHYTCLNTTGVCTEVNFISTTSNVSGLYVFTLKNGETMTYAMERAFANVNSSTVKEKIDSWFAGHMIDGFLEDTIWCNDKNYFYFDFFGRQSPYYVPYDYNGRQSLISCPNMSRDGYSVTTESGGNGTLTYPVGLLTYPEYRLAGAISYLTTGEKWLTMSPALISSSGDVFSISASGYQSTVGTWEEAGVRPVVSLKHDIKVKSGDGTVSSPYELEL